MTKTAKAEQAVPMPGVELPPPRHRVLYCKPEKTADYQPVGSYQLGDADEEAQGGYLFDSIRAERINKARAAGAPVPFFLEQTEVRGLKVEG